jgi:hypothetical protein
LQKITISFLWFKVLFSEMDTANQVDPMDVSGVGEKEGLPIEAFAKVQEMFSNVDWLDPTGDAAIQLFQRLTSSENMQLRQGFLSPSKKEIESLELDLISPTKQSRTKSNSTEQSTEGVGGQRLTLLEPATDSHVKPGTSVVQGSLGSQIYKVDVKTEQPTSPDKTVPSTMVSIETDRNDRNAKLDVQYDSVQCSAPTPISTSCSALSGNSSPRSVSASPRFHSATSSHGITAMLEDNAAFSGSEKSVSTVTSPTVLEPSTGVLNVPPKLPSGQHPTGLAL